MSIKKSQAKFTESIRLLAAGHLVFWKPWPARSCWKKFTKHMVSSSGFRLNSEPSVNPWNAILEIHNVFQGPLTFLNRHICAIVWFSRIFSICEIYWKDRTAGHLVFWKPWPVTGHFRSLCSELFMKFTSLGCSRPTHRRLKFKFLF